MSGWLLIAALLFLEAAVLLLLDQPLLAFSFTGLGLLVLGYQEVRSERTVARGAYRRWLARTRRRQRLTRRREWLARHRAVARRPGLATLLLPLVVFGIVLYVLLANLLFFAVVTSESMSPSFGTGDLVLMQGFDTAPREGDIVLFPSPVDGRAVIHRVVDVQGDKVLTQGDAVGSPDPWVVDADAIQSKAVQVDDTAFVLEEIGWYFIRNAPPQEGPFGGLRFTRLAVGLLKELGLALFFVALLLYVLLTARDFYRGRP